MAWNLVGTWNGGGNQSFTFEVIDDALQGDWSVKPGVKFGVQVLDNTTFKTNADFPAKKGGRTFKLHSKHQIKVINIGNGNE